jgi:hypothetical protein
MTTATQPPGNRKSAEHLPLRPRRGAAYSARRGLLTLAAFFSLGLGANLAQAAIININAQSDWPGGGAGGTLNLNDGDVLNIAAAAAGAGSPTFDTVIQLAPNANVTLNGPVGVVVNNVLLRDGADTAVHTVTLNNLRLNVPLGEDAYAHQRGVLDLNGANELTGGGGGAVGFGIRSSGNPSILTIGSATGGTLDVTTDGAFAIYLANAPQLHIQGNAVVTAAGSSGVEFGGGGSGRTITVAANAMLYASGTGSSGIGIRVSGSDPFAIVNDGYLDASGIGSSSRGIDAALLPLTISGAGESRFAGGSAGIDANALTVSGGTVFAAGNTAASAGLNILGTASTLVQNGAQLNLRGGPALAGTPGLTLELGATVTIESLGNAGETHAFTMAASAPAGSAWQLTNTTPAGASTVSPLNVAVATGQTGTITLGAGGGVPGGGLATVPTLGEWGAALLALMLGALALGGVRWRG